MLDKIQTSNTGYNSGLGTGNITGMLDAGFGIVFCPPVGVGAFTVGQAMQIVYDYMLKHPKLLSKSADQSVAGAL